MNYNLSLGLNQNIHSCPNKKAVKPAAYHHHRNLVVLLLLLLFSLTNKNPLLVYTSFFSEFIVYFFVLFSPSLGEPFSHKYIILF